MTDMNYKFETPECSDWLCDIFNDGGTVTITPKKGKEPSPLHRFMQELVFGVRWRKIKPDVGGSQ